MVELKLPTHEPQVPVDAIRHLGYIVTEAKTNVWKHAGVKQATVVVRRVNNRTMVQVTDEGKGFDLAGIEHARTGLGLSTMRERAQEIGGDVDIRSAIGSGTQVTVSLPLAALELVGTLAKCFALMVRLFVNLMAGHGLLAVLMMFVFQASADYLSAGLGPAVVTGAVCVIFSVLVCLLEILVAVLHAYIFTYLSAIFFGLYAEGHHSG
jgi:hypothetical protein